MNSVFFITSSGVESLLDLLDDDILREDIPAYDYCRGLYERADPMHDLESEDHHEVPSRYTRSGKPVTICRDDLPSAAFEERGCSCG